MSQRPLFIPLATEHFNRFKSGVKKLEFRKYGNRWNEQCCTVGRAVTLSRGYGKYERLAGVVVSFDRITAADLSAEDSAAMRKLFGDLGTFEIARIGIDLV